VHSTAAPPPDSPPPADTPATPPPERQRFGTVAILGAPNAGKSTLVNALVGSKVSIVTPKVQTTRTRITGIALVGDAQIVLHDTPGIFAAKRALDSAMVDAAWTGMNDSDLAVVLVDARRKPDVVGDDTARIVDGLVRARRKAILVLNKVDLVAKPTLLALASTMTGEGSPFTDVFMISALKGSGVDDLKAFLAAKTPPGPWHYPADQMADAPLRFLAAEITREKLFLALFDELPYGLTVETENWDERGGKKGVRIDQRIYIARESHKPIELGKGGTLLRDIGTQSRTEIAKLLGRPVHLFLTVQVRPGWIDEPARWREMGLEFRRT
jgi:GTP-binding protein Era